MVHRRRLRLTRLLVVVVAVLSGFLVSVHSFVSPASHHCHYPCIRHIKQATTSRSVRLSANQLSFSGDSKASIRIPFPKDSFRSWLHSSDSNLRLLGSDDATQQQQQEEEDEGLWYCPQPRVEFLGLDLVPVFVNRLEHSPHDGSTTVHIVEAKTEILQSSANNAANRLVASLMERATFQGKSVIRVDDDEEEEYENDDTGNNPRCRLSVDLNLKLQVPLPRFLPLPPGFNSIGSAIVRRTGQTRTKQLLQDLEQDFKEFTQTQSSPLEVLPQEGDMPTN